MTDAWFTLYILFSRSSVVLKLWLFKCSNMFHYSGATLGEQNVGRYIGVAFIEGLFVTLSTGIYIIALLTILLSV